MSTREVAAALEIFILAKSSENCVSESYLLSQIEADIRRNNDLPFGVKTSQTKEQSNIR